MLRSALGVVCLVSAVGCGGTDAPPPDAAVSPASTVPVAEPSLAPVAEASMTPGAPPPTAFGAAPGPGSLAGMPYGSPDPAAAAAIPAKDRVLWMQVMLDRAHFSPGEIDGVEGSSHRRAVAAFARARNVAPADVPAHLAADKSPVLTTYTIAAEDVAGPFRPIPEDMMQKAKLDKLGYTSALEGLAEKFHASPRLLQRLNPGKKFDRAGETIEVPNVHMSAPPAKAAKVVVDESDGSVEAFDAQGRLLASYPATMGSQNDPLPIGDWTINGVSKDPPFNYNPDLFWDAKATHAKARLAPGPNNPVGRVWIDLSKEHYGIHGTPVPSTIGKTESHGCIRLTNWDALELAEMVSPGIPAILQN